MVIALTSKLVWQSVQASSFDVKFGLSSTPPLVSAGQIGSTYTPTLTIGGIYYWQIIAYNGVGSTAGPVWSFYYVPLPATVVDNDPLLLYDPMPTSTFDISQIRTRVFISGAGSTLVNPYSAGTTAIEIKDNSMFADAGGTAIIGSQRFHYSGKTASIFSGEVGGSGSSTSVSAPRTMIQLDVNGQIVSGKIKQPCLYKVSYIINGVETPLSDASNDLRFYPFQLPGVWGVSNIVTVTTGGNMANDRYFYLMSAFTDDGETFPGGISDEGQAFLTGPNNAVLITNIRPAAEAGGGAPSVRVRGRRLWRNSLKYHNPNGGGQTFMLVATLDNVVSSYLDRANDATLTTPAPTDEFGQQMNGYNTTGSQINVTVSEGPSGTTARKIYRARFSIFTGEISPYELITTINNNLPPSILNVSNGLKVSYIDNTDTGYPLFKTNAASTSTPTPNVPPPTPPPLHYFLTGIPASGSGSLTSDVKAGDAVNIFVQRDNLSAQIALAALEGGDGIHEAPVISDTKLLSDATCIIRGDAELALFSAPIQTVKFATRDPNVHSGSMVTFNLTNPPITGTLMIQEVLMDLIRINDGLAPRFTVTASSVKFSLNDFMRKAVL